jgi:hypothetical protein
MAGDWIKMEVTTADKPEVAMMAHKLRCEPDLVVGKLFRVWVWANMNCVDGNAVTVTEAFLDRIAHRKGFAAAMRSAGWLSGSNGALCFPGFERHNGKTAKARAMGNRRVSKHRSGNESVTHAPLQKALPEKRREEEVTEVTSLGGAKELPDVVALYPKREKVAEAIEALAVHVRKGADLDAVRSGTQAIAAVIARLPGAHLNAYVPSAAQFFRHRRWEDDPQTWLRNAGKHGNGAPQQTLDLGGRRPASHTLI